VKVFTQENYLANWIQVLIYLFFKISLRILKLSVLSALRFQYESEFCVCRHCLIHCQQRITRMGYWC